MYNMLSLDHEVAPPYVEPCNGQKRAKGTIFLTVSLHQTREGETSGKQEYRLDVPLEPETDTPTRIFVRKPRRGEQMTSPQIHKHGAHESVDSKTTQKIAAGFRMSKFYSATNRNYILSPACIAEITMRLTLSSVTDWPKAVVLGQTQMDLFHYVLWRRAASFVQDFTNAVLWENLPAPGDGSVLLLSLPRPQSLSKKLSTTLPGIDAQPNSPVMAKGGVESKASYIVSGGFVTWSVLPFTDMSENHYGALCAFAGSTLDSASKRMWFVLVDSVLYVYGTTSSKPKHQFPMLSVACSYVDGQVGMFKLRTPSETFYLRDEDEKSGRQWFRKLYEQSPHHKSFEALEAAMQTPWAAADAALAAQLEEQRRTTVLGSTSNARKNNLLQGLKKVANLTAVDETKGVISKKK
jgi:hypothetical protein